MNRPCIFPTESLLAISVACMMVRAGRFFIPGSLFARPETRDGIIRLQGEDVN